MPGSGKLKTLFIITRPWSFPMTLVVLLSGVALAAWHGYSPPPALVAAAALGSVLLHAMVNVLNDYYDTLYGVDRPEAGTATYRPHPLIHGILTPAQVFAMGAASGLVGLLLGLFIAFNGRPLAVPLGIAGLAAAFWYTGPPLRLKYVGLGELTTFLVWGPLIFGGGYYVASGKLPVDAAAASVPLGLLVTAVLLANNIRDVGFDSSANVRTLAVRIGRDAAVKLYKALIVVPYLVTALLVATRTLPPLALAVLLTLPKALELYRMFEAGSPPDADPRTASMVFKFGLIYLASIIIAALAGLG